MVINNDYSNRWDDDYEDDDLPQIREPVGDEGADPPSYEVRFEEHLESLNEDAHNVLYKGLDITEYPVDQRLEYEHAYINAFNDATRDASEDERLEAAQDLAHRMISPYQEILDNHEAEVVMEFMSTDDITIENLQERGVDFTTHDVIVIPRAGEGEAYQLTADGPKPIEKPEAFRPVYVDPADEFSVDALTLESIEGTIRDILMHSADDVESSAHQIDETLVQAAAFVRQYRTDVDQDEDATQPDEAPADSDENRGFIDDLLEDKTALVFNVLTAVSLGADVYPWVSEMLGELSDNESVDALLNYVSTLHQIRTEQMINAGNNELLQEQVAGYMVGDAQGLVHAAENHTGLAAVLPEDFSSVIDLPERMETPEQLSGFISSVDDHLEGGLLRAGDDPMENERQLSILHYHLDNMRAARDQMQEATNDGLYQSDPQTLQDINQHAEMAKHVLDRMNLAGLPTS